jgi:transcriptional regulator with XRE-family HTH domain
MNPEKFGRNLKQIMDTLGMSQRELAENAGLTPAAVSQILAGKREPSLTTICLILRVIPVKFERLVSL